MPDQFKLNSQYKPRGDQPFAIEQLVSWLKEGKTRQTLLGVTGSGKTFSMAKIIEAIQRPTLILSPNKTLAAHLYSEFCDLFPENAVEYFISYYDYYQPEAYIPGSGTFIEKETSINEQIDKLRHSATRSLLERRDVIIVASVSCIYGLGSPEYYKNMLLPLEVGQEIARDGILMRLVDMQYKRNNIDFHRGTFRVLGDTVDIFPVHEDQQAIRIVYWGDTIEGIALFDPLTGKKIESLKKAVIYPGSHYVTPEEKREEAIRRIQSEMLEQVAYFKKNHKYIEAQRIEERTCYDLELLEEMGFCSGIENYSRHLGLREAGAAPSTLIDYFPDDFIVFADESHVSMPQLGAMYKGDQARKKNLVDYGFRLPSARDNRPLNFDEVMARMKQLVFVSATPTDYEKEESKGRIAEQLIRPTGLLEPLIEVRPQGTQVDDVMEEIRIRTEKNERVLVTTLTKRMAEDLSDYLKEAGIKVAYLHSDIESLERFEIIRNLRLGIFDVIVGINLLREGLDMPEVSLVAVLDADKEGFLRSRTSLIQVMGRAARNVNGLAILYADRITGSMQVAIDETTRRREKQMAHNKKFGIVPETIESRIKDSLIEKESEADYIDVPIAADRDRKQLSQEETFEVIEDLKTRMYQLAEDLEFEEAAKLRDQVRQLEESALGYGNKISATLMAADKPEYSRRGRRKVVKKINGRRVSKRK